MRAALATPVAGLTPPEIEINGTQIGLDTLNCQTRNSELACGGTGLQGSGYSLDSWEFLLNPDPSISGSFTLTNLSPITQTFSISVTLGIAPVGPPVSITGSVGPGNLTDLNANGATLTDTGIAIYTARIDGSPVHTLLDPPQSFFAPANPFGGPSTVPIPAASFGPDVLAQAATSSIGTSFSFTLTPSDSVQLPFTFVVTAVPLPGALMLFCSGLTAIVAFHRRRSSG